MRTTLAILVLFMLSLANALAAPKILFQNYKIHTVVTSDNVGLKVLELLGPNSAPMANARPMVLMHGFTSNWHNWVTLADTYRNHGLRVFIVNWRGHGQGSHRSVVLGEQFNTNDPRYNYHRLATVDVPTVIDFAYRISGNKKVIYHSHSMGGMMANLAFSGVKVEANGKVVMSLEHGRAFEKKVFAYIPVAAPNSLRAKEFFGSSYLEYGLNLFGIHGDRSDDIQLPFQASRTRAAYWAMRANPLIQGLINLQHMTVEEYGIMAQYGVSDVSKSLGQSLYDMRRDFYGTEDRTLNYEEISQARAANFYRSRIPTMMISATTDSLALIDQQIALAAKRQCKHVILEAGHVDIIAAKVWAKRVALETLNFIGSVR